MKTIKEIRLDKLAQMARENVANSENAILKLYDSFVEGTIQANKARRNYQNLRNAFIIDLKRYNSILIAIDPDKSVENPKFWEDYYNNIFA